MTKTEFDRIAGYKEEKEPFYRAMKLEGKGNIYLIHYVRSLESNIN